MVGLWLVQFRKDIISLFISSTYSFKKRNKEFTQRNDFFFVLVIQGEKDFEINKTTKSKKGRKGDEGKKRKGRGHRVGKARTNFATDRSKAKKKRAKKRNWKEKGRQNGCLIVPW